MDEGAGDQLDNSSKLQEQDENKLSKTALSASLATASSSASSSSSSAELAASISQSQAHNAEQFMQHQPPHLNQQQQQQISLSSSINSSSSPQSTQSAVLASQNKQQTDIQRTAFLTDNPNNKTKSNDSSANTNNKQNSEEPQNKAKSSNNNGNDHLSKRNLTEELFSSKKWGVTPVRQDTPWALPPSPTQNRPVGANGPAGMSSSAVMANSAPTLPPGISQSGDSFRSGSNVSDFQSNAIVNSFGIDNIGANGLANSLGHMSLGGTGIVHSARLDQPWRAPVAKPHAGLGSTFAGQGIMNPTAVAPGPIQKSVLANAASPYSSMAQGNEFARAPGPASTLMDSSMTPKPFGMTNRSSTWSAFGSTTPNDSDSEWPKSTTSGISAVNQAQAANNAFDLVPEFEPGKSWHGGMLMKNLDDEPLGGTATGLSAFAGPYASSSTTTKSPTEGQYEASSMGTWSPVVKSGRPNSKWDGDGPGDGQDDDGRFDDGTAIWGSPAQSKAAGIDWAEKTGGVGGGNNDKSRNMSANNQAYRSQQASTSSSSTASLLMSSNTSPSSQGNRNSANPKQPSISHNFDQVQQQTNALSSQSTQPNRGLSSNVPSTQHLKLMVQQIQLAVAAGHLNPQILNQPLAPVTLQLLYQLLQQIRNLHTLQMQATPQFGKPGANANVNVHITKTKQNIMSLQNQIGAQQAMYLKQAQAPNISSRQPTMPNLAAGGIGSGLGPALPPGISNSGDSFRSGSALNDFQNPGMPNSFGMDSMSANGLANSLNHMNFGNSGGILHSSRFDQPWRAPAAKPSLGTSFAGQSMMNPAPGPLQKSVLGGGGPSYVGMQQSNEFARAPGPASSMMDSVNPKPFGMANRSSTWSAFGTQAPNESDQEWPKTTTTSGISSSNQSQLDSNAFDLVPEFEPGKPWRGSSMLMKNVEDDPTMTPASMARSLAPQRKTIWSDEIL